MFFGGLGGFGGQPVVERLNSAARRRTPKIFTRRGYGLTAPLTKTVRYPDRPVDGRKIAKATGSLCAYQGASDAGIGGNEQGHDAGDQRRDQSGLERGRWSGTDHGSKVGD